MRQVKKLGPVLLTLLLLAVGAFLPRLAALAQDRTLLGGITLWEDPQISLVLDQDMEFFEVLEFFDLGKSQIVLSEGRRRTVEEVRAAAAETMSALMSVSYAEPEATPVLITGRDDPGRSAVCWRCVWTDGDGGKETLWLDDGSGLMVALQGRVGTPTVSFVKSLYQEPALLVAEFCRTAYPADEVKVAVEESGEDYGDYRLSFVREAGGRRVVYTAPLRLSGGWIYFNL